MILQSTNSWDPFQLHKIIFKRGLSKEYVLSQLESAKSLSSQYKWNLTDKRYVLFEMKRVFQMIEILLISHLYLSYNEFDHIRTIGIIHIRFQCLESLTLEKNNIKNVEILTKLDAPCLNTLWLGHNQIVQIKSLRKMNVPQLVQLFINDNPIQSYCSLFQLQAKSLQYIHFGKFLLLAPPKLQSVHWLVKIQSNSSTILDFDHIKMAKKFRLGLESKFQ